MLAELSGDCLKNTPRVPVFAGPETKCGFEKLRKLDDVDSSLTSRPSGSGQETTTNKGGSDMKTSSWKSTLSVLAGLLAVAAWALPAQAESPKKGGILK